MIVVFSEEEMEWIDKMPFAWKIRNGCPAKLREALQKKLDLIRKNAEDDRR